MDWQVYILECADGTLYTGVARDLQKRLRQHNGQLAGGPKYTRGRRPVQLAWSEAAIDRSAAQRREAAIKNLGRAEKLQLISSGQSDSTRYKNNLKSNRTVALSSRNKKY